MVMAAQRVIWAQRVCSVQVFTPSQASPSRAALPLPTSQASVRGMLARQLAQRLRLERAALVFQTRWRTVSAQRYATARRSAAVRLQAAWRAVQARQLVGYLQRCGHAWHLSMSRQRQEESCLFPSQGVARQVLQGGHG